ncbi:MAG: cell division protein ZapA [Clostridiales bacterium]|nr:cell division protein ZapA [Candidatus Equinaster intestinalis]
MANVIRMKIGGIEYSITSDEDSAYIKGIASELERKLNAVQQKSPFLSTTMAAIVTALECMDENKKTEAENERLRLDIKKLLEETACAKLDADLYKRKLEELTGMPVTDDAADREIEVEETETTDDFGDLPF